MTKSPKSLLNRFDTFMRVDIGGVFVLISLCSSLISAEAADIGFALTALYMLIFLSRMPKEEFARVCWMRGCSAVFIALLIWMIIVPFIGGFIDGYMASINAPANSPMPDLMSPGSRPHSPYEATITDVIERTQPLALFAFFLGFQWQRFRGSST